MANDTQTVIEVLFTGLLAIHRPARGGIGVGIHRSAPDHSLIITLREAGGQATRLDYPLVVADRSLTDDMYLRINGKAPNRELAFDADQLKLLVLDGQGFHNRPLAVQRDALTPCFYLDDAEFSSQAFPLYVIHRQSRELREVALELSARITLQGDERALLSYGNATHSFTNDGRSHRLWVSNLEDLWHMDSDKSDFHYYYSVFSDIAPEDRYDVASADNGGSDKEATYQRPCIPIFLESSMS